MDLGGRGGGGGGSGGDHAYAAPPVAHSPAYANPPSDAVQVRTSWAQSAGAFSCFDNHQPKQNLDFLLLDFALTFSLRDFSGIGQQSSSPLTAEGGVSHLAYVDARSDGNLSPGAAYVDAGRGVNLSPGSAAAVAVALSRQNNNLTYAMPASPLKGDPVRFWGHI